MPSKGGNGTSTDRPVVAASLSPPPVVRPAECTYHTMASPIRTDAGLVSLEGFSQVIVTMRVALTDPKSGERGMHEVTIHVLGPIPEVLAAQLAASYNEAWKRSQKVRLVGEARG